MTTEIMHQPTPEFRDFLEGEITREFRRHRSYGRMRVAAGFIAALAVGASAGLASAQIRQDAQRDSLLQAAQSELWLIGLRLELARSLFAQVQSKVQTGVAGQSSLARAETELRQMEAVAARGKLNVDEIRASGKSPCDDLNAPVVAGRDFVTERVQLDLFKAQHILTSAEQAQAEAERQFRVGAIGELAVMDATLATIRARSALGTYAERRKLRKEFVDLGTPVDQLDRRFRQAQVEFDAYVAQEEVNVLRRRLDALRKQQGAGAAGELDVLRAEIQLREREVEFGLLAQQLRELRKPRDPSESGGFGRM